MYRMTDEEFEAAMQEALDAIPEQFLDALHNIAIVWQDEPNDYHLGFDADYDKDGWEDGEWADEDAEAWDEEQAPVGALEPRGEEPGGDWDPEAEGDYDDFGVEWAGGRLADQRELPNNLLGLFDGLSIQERLNGVDDDIPDVITIFKGPHERCFGSREEVVKEIGKTIIHELGHYFGLSEERLAAMGYE